MTNCATEPTSINPKNIPLISLDNVGYTINENAFKRQQEPQKRASFWLASARSNRTTKTANIKSTLPTPKTKDLLTHISLNILPNEKISVIGPNGAGKSTLMKLMLGLIKPTSGSISKSDNLNIGYVPQRFSIPAILPLRVIDLLNQVKCRITKEQQLILYKLLSIEALLKQQVIHLSGGETQRVLLARSLLNKPSLLILDEPMQGLDPESERWLYEFIDDLPDFLQCAMVVVSHDLHWVMKGSRRVICLNKHICCEGQPSDLGVSEEFKKLFGHQYEQPYVHKPHVCEHHGLESL